ncbi:MAG: hypothetical protein KDD44_08765, partial [Bdellovibrionales bacterium]|nr:hypothetical protein [Bdellovibrionales bacterium]
MERESSPEGNYPWILHPVIDLLFCCGGLVWVFYLVQLAFFDSLDSFQRSEWILGLLVILGHLFSDPHTAATLVRVYQREDTRSRYRFCVTWAAAICSLILLAGLLIGPLPPYLLKGYVVLVIHHYTSQTYGIALLYCYKRGFRLSAAERRVVWLVVNLTAAFAIIREFTFEAWGGRRFMYLELPFIGPLPTWIFHASGILLALSGLSFVALF